MNNKGKCIVCGAKLPENTTPGTSHVRRSAKHFVTCRKDCSKIYNRISSYVWIRFMNFYKVKSYNYKDKKGEKKK